MKIITIANLKGGVGKTVTAITISYLLAAEHGKRVLAIDNDQQGSISHFFGRYGYEHPGMSEVLTRKASASEVIQHTGYDRLDIIAANLSLAAAEKEVLTDSSIPQQVRLREAMFAVKDQYDYVIIDNAPSLGMCVINALTTSNYLLIPAKIDKWTFDGINSMLQQVEQIQRYFNNRLTFMGTLITSYRRNDSNEQGAKWLSQAKQYKTFDTHIRWTDKVDESTFANEPIIRYSPRCGATRDYRTFVREMLRLMGDVSDSGTKKVKK
jgi:chromosome partitioning protein